MASPEFVTVTHTLLFVDPDLRLANLLGQKLGPQWAVVGASNLQEADSQLVRVRPDVVMGEAYFARHWDGLEFLGRCQSVGIPALVWTSRNIDELVRPARQQELSVLLAKTHPIQFEEMIRIIKAFVEPLHPGLTRYLSPEGMQLGHLHVEREEDVAQMCKTIQESLHGSLHSSRKLRLVLDELATNALHHGQGSAIDVLWAKDREHHVFVVWDRAGGLQPDEALRVIDRHFRSEGLMDPRGRGLHLSRIYADRLYLTVQPGVCTEAAAIFWNHSGAFQGYKPVCVQCVSGVKEN